MRKRPKPALATIKRLMGYLGRYRARLALAFIFAAIANLLLVFAPYLVGRGVDAMGVAGHVEFAALGAIALTLLIMYAVSALTQWALSAVLTRALAGVVSDMRRDMYATLNRCPVGYFDAQPHGDIISRFTSDADAVLDGLLQGSVQLFSGVITVIGALGFMLSLSPLITLAVAALTPLCFLVGFFVSRVSSRSTAEQQAKLGELSGFCEEIIAGGKTVKAFGYEQRARERFEKLNAELYVCGQKAQFTGSLVNPTTRYLNNLAFMLVGLLGGLGALSGGLSVGGISSFLTYAAIFAKPFNEISAVMTNLITALISAGRIFEEMDAPAEAPDAPDALTLANVRGEVEFSNVCFAYDPARPLIESLNLRAEPGDTIAIVGPTGAGKTTLINLLMRFYEHDSGTIRVDGCDVERATRASLRRSFAMVLQDTWLLSGTVRENIAYGKANATEDEIINAAKAARAHAFISRLSDGYDTEISEAANLSQGQRQQLCIARMILCGAPMLILDEATSSVDIVTEHAIQASFKEMMQGRTSFVIAHRLSTIREADLILVMRNGGIVEQGSHAQLLAKNGFYAQLYNSQFAHS